MLNPFRRYLILITPAFLLIASSYCHADYDCDEIYQWSSAINFSTGNLVRYKGFAYRAQGVNIGQSPDANSGANEAWKSLGACKTEVTVSCDFNGDGKLDIAKGFSNADLVTGKSNSDIPNSSDFRNAGEVTITYGSNLNRPADRVWDQNSLGMFAYAREFAWFGEALSVGDYNHDSFCDLAIGAPGFGVSEGLVNILYGSPNGLTIIVLGESGRPINPYDAQRFNQSSPDVPGGAEIGDQFGDALATGDINGDGFDDLIVGVPGESIVLGAREVSGAGYIHIFYGSKHGIQTSSPKTVGYMQHISGVSTEVESGDHFGSGLASADFDHDGFADLAVSASGENDYHGMVSVFRGSATGIDKSSRIDFTHDTFSPEPPLTKRRNFGRTLRAVDFNNDSYPDLEVDYTTAPVPPPVTTSAPSSSFHYQSSSIGTLQIPGSPSGLIINQ